MKEEVTHSRYQPVVGPQETTSLMCTPVSVQATLAPTWDREHAQRGAH